MAVKEVDEKDLSERQGTKNKIKEIERAVIAILNFIKEIETENDVEYMASGEYLGVKFE